METTLPSFASLPTGDLKPFPALLVDLFPTNDTYDACFHRSGANGRQQSFLLHFVVEALLPTSFEQNLSSNYLSSLPLLIAQGPLFTPSSFALTLTLCLLLLFLPLPLFSPSPISSLSTVCSLLEVFPNTNSFLVFSG